MIITLYFSKIIIYLESYMIRVNALLTLYLTYPQRAQQANFAKISVKKSKRNYF